MEENKVNDLMENLTEENNAQEEAEITEAINPEEVNGSMSETPLTEEEPSGTGSGRKYCTNCGEPLKPGQKFCGNCGMKFDIPKMDTVAAKPVVKEGILTGQRSVNKKPLMIAGAVLIAAILLFVLISGSGKNFKNMYKEYASESWCTIAEDGSYMEIDTNPLDINDDFNSDAYNAIKKVNKDLGFSAAVENQMANTRSLDGRQTAESKKATVSWTFHPNSGLEVIYEWK